MNCRERNLVYISIYDPSIYVVFVCADLVAADAMTVDAMMIVADRMALPQGRLTNLDRIYVLPDGNRLD